MSLAIRIQTHSFDLAAETLALTMGKIDIGAVVSFVGLCRDDGGRLSALELEHYHAMAEGEIMRIAAQAQSRWPLYGLTIIHRVGLIQPGEGIVLVLAASRHRRAAFDAAAFLMDYLKTRAPIWKREHLKDGTVGRWIEPKSEDNEATERWG